MAELKAVHANVITSGLGEDLFIVSRILSFSAVSVNGELSYAKSIFEKIQQPTISMYNSLIRGFSNSTEPIEGLQLYRRMIRRRISPDRLTFPFLIRCCSILQYCNFGSAVHSHAMKLGFESDIFVVNNAIAMYSSFADMRSARSIFDLNAHNADVISWTSIISGYVNSHYLDQARSLFDRMPSKNVISWNAMIAGYAREGRKSEARKLFEEMPEKNSASWGALISGFSQSGLCREALVVFNEMLLSGATPTEPAIVSAVSACAQLRDLEEGERLQCYMEKYVDFPSTALYTALVDMFGKCGSVTSALEIFCKMPCRNIFSWNSMIAGLAMNGQGERALTFFWKMLLCGHRPNGTSFLGVLGACSHGGLVNEGQKLFFMMTRELEIEPLPEHYGCMVDLLGRAGLIKEARDIMESMPFEPHAGMVGALAGACRKHGEEELGEELGKKLVEMEPEDAGRYALLSNMYAAARRWDEVVEVRMLLRKRGGMKIAGSSKELKI